MVSSIYLSINFQKPQLNDLIEEISVEANMRNITVVDNPKEADAIISVGGDGTFLYASHLAIQHNKIVAGLNLGSFGFLPSFEQDQIPKMLDSLKAGDEYVSEKSLIKVTSKDNETVVINEAVIERSRSDRALRLDVEITQDSFSNESDYFVTDGIILATPTGSTAYASSAGGPVVDDSLSAMVLAFVALHHPKIDPIVLDRSKKVKIKVHDDAVLATDGKCIMELTPESEVFISASETKLLVCEDQPSILKRVLRSK